MTTIKLLNIEITNFKGISEFKLPFDGNGVSIYGRNFAGKTSIYDAFCWVLFDKDSSGNKSFDIKPLDTDNKVKYPGADTTVKLELSIDRINTELKKVYHEVWTQQRGSIDKVFSGHTSEYYIDDIPTKKNEFDRYISDIIDETKFRMLTNVYMFCEDMNWQDRRKILFEMCGIEDDLTLMIQDDRFNSLIPFIQKHTIEKYKTSIAEKRKSLVTEKNKIPESISAYTAVKTDAEQINYSEIEVDKTVIEKTVKSLTTKIIEIKNDTAISTLKNEYNALSNDLIKLDNENTVYRNSQSKVDDSGYITQKNELNTQLSDLTYKLKTAINEMNYESDTAERLNKERLRIRAEYEKPADENEEYCPTCRRLYESADLEQIRTAHKNHRMELRERGIKLKEQSETAESNVTKIRKEKDGLQSQIESVKMSLAELKIPDKPIIYDMDDYNDRKFLLTSKQAEIKQQMREIETESMTVLTQLQSSLSKANAELSSINDKLSQRAVITDMERRIGNLIDKERTLATEIEGIDEQIYLCEEFIKYKISFVEDSINRRFSIIKFKLFEEQINGGIKDCCDVLYKGVPFTNASRSEQINAALDVIQTLSEFYNISVPLFVDNAESVTKLYNINTQVIRLIVSENDKELRCESYVAETKKKTEIDNPAA